MKTFLRHIHYTESNDNLLCINYLSNISNSNNMTELNSLYKIKNFTSNGFNINLIYNVNNLYVIQNNIKLDILKNYFDGNYFYVYDLSKIELQTDYVIKDKLDNKLKDIILYYRNIDYKIYLTE